MRSDALHVDTGQDGFALVAVLVFMLVVSAIVVPFALTARTRLMIASNEIEQERLALVADGLVNVVATELFDGPTAAGMPVNGEPAQCRAGHMAIEVRVQDHDGLIDLNAGGTDSMALGFAALGFDRQDAETLARSVVSSRTPRNGFALAQEAPALDEGESKHAPFESVSELQPFSALASMRIHDLYEVFTVNSKRGTVDPTNAPKRLGDLFGSGGEQAGHAEQAGSVYSIEISVRRDGSGIVGRAGFIVERFSQLAAGFGRISQIPGGDADDNFSTGPAPTVGCNAMFGDTVSGMLERWAA